MKKIIAIIMTLTLILGIFPAAAIASGGSIIYFSDFTDTAAANSAITFVGEHEYAYDESDAMFIGNFLQLNSFPLPEDGETLNTRNPKATFDIADFTITNGMYAVVQMDWRMEDMANDNKNIYLDFPKDNAINLTPNGRIKANTEYNLKTLCGWKKADWTRFQLIYNFSVAEGAVSATLTDIYVNGTVLENFTDVTYTLTGTEVTQVVMHLSQHKTGESSPVLYNADVDNFGIYTMMSAPVIADSTQLKETIKTYNDYFVNIESGVDAQKADEFKALLHSGADAVNNPLSTENEISAKKAEIENKYKEVFLGENYDERRAYMYQKYTALYAIVTDEEQKKLYSEDELAAIEKVCDEMIAVYNDPLAPLFKIEQQIKNAENVVSTDVYSVKSVSVATQDNTEVNDFFPSGKFQKITLIKRSFEALDGEIYIVFYDEDGKITKILKQTATAAADTVGEVAVDFSSHNYTLDADIRTGSVGIFLWDGELVPLMQQYVREDLNMWTAYYNDNEILPDSMPMYKSGGEIYVGVKYFLNLMGITVESDNNRYTAKRDSDGAYIDFTLGETTVKSKNGDITLTIPAEAVEGKVAILPIDVLCDVFGCSATLDAIYGRLYIIYDASAHTAAYNVFSQWFSGYTRTYTADSMSATYTLEVPSGVTDVDVWYMPVSGKEDSVFNTTVYNRNMEHRYWQKAIKPIKTGNKTYKGSLPFLRTATSYKIKYAITKDGKTTIYKDVKYSGYSNPTTSEAVLTTAKAASAKTDILYTATDLTLVPTYENIGYYIDYEDAVSCTVTYRKSGDTAWKNAYTPYNDTVEKQFRGSIVKLEDNTTYEVKAVLSASDNTTTEKTATVTTWNDAPTVTAKKLTDYYTVTDNKISQPIQFVGIKGSADNWIEIDCTGYSVEAGYNTTAAVALDDCEYVILKGLTVKGGYRFGIAVNAGCSNVRLSGCDISSFGRTGIQHENGWYYRDATPINYDAGVLLIDGSNITVEDCYIHDSRAMTNAWSGATWESTHPNGSAGIVYDVDNGCVIRNNRIIGNATHRFNDGIESFSNGSYVGGAARDTDIYSNTIQYGQDDAIELDGGQMNTRVYKNKLSQFLCGISIVPNLCGPSYVFENEISNMGTDAGNNGKALKAGGSESDSVTYVFNNTFFVNGVVVENTTYGGTEEYNLVTRNNIFVNTYGGGCYKNTFDGALNDNNYDFCFGNYVNYQNGGSSMLYTAMQTDSFEKKSIEQIKDMLAFTDAENGDFTLKNGSSCIGGGVYIDNFCESSLCNIGAN